MPEEIEAKLPVESHDVVRRALADCGAVRLGEVLERNHILDSADRVLGAAGAALRVRSSRCTSTGDATHTLTYKGPVQAGQLKRREEIELRIDDPQAALAFLRSLGYQAVLVFEKRRESHSVGACRVELDEVPLIRSYVEIEGPGEEAISGVQSDLGLGGIRHEPRSYVALLLERCRRDGLDPLNVAFA